MSKLEVQSVKFKKEFTTGNGITLRSYTVMGLLDGDLDMVEMNAKSDATAPKIGETLEVTIEVSQWGKKAKKVQQGNYGGKAHGGYSEDPEKQAMIVRQNSLSNAVTFAIGKLTLEKKPDELTPEYVLLIAEKFAQYSMGKLKPSGVIESMQNMPAEEPYPFEDVEQYDQEEE